MTVRSGGGAVTQTGQLVVTGDTNIAAGTGVITLLNPLNNFAGSLALQGTSTSVATSGDLQLANVTNSGPMVLRAPRGSIDLGSAFITGGDLTLESRDDMNLGGANIAGNLNMSSTQGTVSFGEATVSGSLNASTNGQQVDLGTALVGGDLSVITNGGDVVQRAPSQATPNAALRVAGATTINAGTGDLTLPNIPNQFAGLLTLQANDVQLVASSNLNLGPTSLSGSLDMRSVTGSITQTAPLTVSGSTQLSASQGNVVLTQANALTQAVSIQAIDVQLNTTSALTLGDSRITGNLVATVAGGDITQTGPVQVTGTTNLVSPAGNITLTDSNNLFGDRVSVSTPLQLQLSANGPLSMGEVQVGGSSDLQSRGKLDLGTQAEYTGKLTAKSGGFEIKQSGPLKAGAAVDFDAGNAKIDLFEPRNLWLGALFF